MIDSHSSIIDLNQIEPIILDFILIYALAVSSKFFEKDGDQTLKRSPGNISGGSPPSLPPPPTTSNKPEKIDFYKISQTYVKNSQ